MLRSEKGPRMGEACFIVNGGLFCYTDEWLQSLGTLWTISEEGWSIGHSRILSIYSKSPVACPLSMSSFLSCHSYCLHSETAAAPPQRHSSDSYMWAMVLPLRIFLYAPPMLPSHLRLVVTPFRHELHEFPYLSRVSSLNSPDNRVLSFLF